MTTLDEVYRKFGEASEAAQLLETALSSILFKTGVVDENLVEHPDPTRASEFIQSINRQTLGQLLKSLNRSSDSSAHLEALLALALAERNRLSHSYYRHHNFRRNSPEGCDLMMKDLESIHDILLEAYRAVMLLSSVDLEKVTIPNLPTRHVPI